MDIVSIKANEGIGKIKLGMEREEVYKVLGKTGDTNAQSEWIDIYHIEYRASKVVFIQLTNTYTNDYFALLHGVDVFRTEAKLLVKYISEFGDYNPSDSELGFSYHFAELGVGFWRPVIFEYEMINDVHFKSMIEENQLDEVKHLYFETVCAYTKDYYTT
jgi:hypothetical protein